MGGGNAPGGIYAAHTDGQIRAFIPTLWDDGEIDDDKVTGEGDDKKRKRKVLDDAFRSLMGKQITFT
jgi:DNA excision repair protein ERCC-8